MIFRGRTLRHEHKFVINPGVYQILRSRLRAVMRPDANGKDGVYSITSLYFDDVFKSAYQDKLAGDSERRKYRIRLYNHDASHIKLEAKHKDGEFVSKDSVRLSGEDAERLIAGERAYLREERFLGTTAEAFAISDSITRLSPAAVTDYIREAYVEPAGNVRVTFDTRLSAGGGLFVPAAGFRFIDAAPYILEVKYDGYLPGHIKALLTALPLTQTSVSKYVLCRDAFPIII